MASSVASAMMLSLAGDEQDTGAQAGEGASRWSPVRASRTTNRPVSVASEATAMGAMVPAWMWAGSSNSTARRPSSARPPG